LCALNIRSYPRHGEGGNIGIPVKFVNARNLANLKFMLCIVGSKKISLKKCIVGEMRTED
jgi:hypothetical protein